MKSVEDRSWDDSLITKDGANRRIAETMFAELEAAGKADLIPIGGTLASYIFSKIDIVVERFPKLLRTARKQVTFTEDPAALRHAIVKLSMSQTADEAKQHLLEMDEEDEDD